MVFCEQIMRDIPMVQSVLFNYDVDFENYQVSELTATVRVCFCNPHYYNGTLLETIELCSRMILPYLYQPKFKIIPILNYN
jgi:hypothetical protein